jgi:hypothetical protein
MEHETKFANVFGNEPDISFAEKLRVIDELNKIGSLTFKVEVHEDGWVAESKEIPAIVTGNTNPNPSAFEIETLIREAIFSAFAVKFESKPKGDVRSPLEFKFETKVY